MPRAPTGVGYHWNPAAKKIKHPEIRFRIRISIGLTRGKRRIRAQDFAGTGSFHFAQKQDV